MAMFWAFVIVTILAFGLFQLGALSVWVGVLKIGLLVATVVVGVLLIVMLWRRTFS